MRSARYGMYVGCYLPFFPNRQPQHSTSLAHLPSFNGITHDEPAAYPLVDACAPVARARGQAVGRSVAVVPERKPKRRGRSPLAPRATRHTAGGGAGGRCRRPRAKIRLQVSDHGTCGSRSSAAPRFEDERPERAYLRFRGNDAAPDPFEGRKCQGTDAARDGRLFLTRWPKDEDMGRAIPCNSHHPPQLGSRRLSAAGGQCGTNGGAGTYPAQQLRSGTLRALNPAGGAAVLLRKERLELVHQSRPRFGPSRRCPTASCAPRSPSRAIAFRSASRDGLHGAYACALRPVPATTPNRPTPAPTVPASTAPCPSPLTDAACHPAQHHDPRNCAPERSCLPTPSARAPARTPRCWPPAPASLKLGAPNSTPPPPTSPQPQPQPQL